MIRIESAPQRSTLNAEEFIDSGLECVRNPKSERQTWLVSPQFNGNYGLPGHAANLAELFLGEPRSFSVVSNAIGYWHV